MLDLCMVGIQQVIFTKFVFGRDIFTCTLYKKVKDTKYPAPDLVRRVVKHEYNMLTPIICSHPCSNMHLSGRFRPISRFVVGRLRSGFKWHQTRVAACVRRAQGWSMRVVNLLTQKQKKNATLVCTCEPHACPT